MGVPRNGWFIRENPIKMDDLRVYNDIIIHTSSYIHMFTSRTATKLVGFAVSTFSHLPGLLYDSNETFTSTMSISGENAGKSPISS